MDVREKLVDLLGNIYLPIMAGPDVIGEYRIPHKLKEEIADHLIANGVTVQEWISVKDKLPPYNRDVLVYRPNMAMEILVDNYSGYYGEDDDEWHEGWALYGEDADGNPVITHWAYFHQPPKGE